MCREVKAPSKRQKVPDFFKSQETGGSFAWVQKVEKKVLQSSAAPNQAGLALAHLELGHWLAILCLPMENCLLRVLHSLTRDAELSGHWEVGPV